MARPIIEGAKRRKLRFSYRASSAGLGERILQHAGRNDNAMRDRFERALAGQDATVKLGIEPR